MGLAFLLDPALVQRKKTNAIIVTYTFYSSEIGEPREGPQTVCHQDSHHPLGTVLPPAGGLLADRVLVESPQSFRWYTTQSARLLPTRPRLVVTVTLLRRCLHLTPHRGSQEFRCYFWF